MDKENRPYKEVLKEKDDRIMELEISHRMHNFEVFTYTVVTFLAGFVIGIFLC